MLANIRHDNGREHAKLFVLGIVFVTVIALLIGVSIAIYNKVFDTGTTITIQADRAGLQLPKFGDVRLHGVLVGQVRSVSDDGTQAVIKVSLDPDEAREIPSNVSVQIIPTTLFGQKFISLVVPDDPSSTPLAAGDVIPASRVSTDVELGQVLAHLFPLLRTVQPAQLNMTLSALANALEGRGQDLGQTLSRLDLYLRGIRPSLPELRQNLVKLASVADTYNVAAPDLLRTLGNLTVTARTVVEKRQQLDAFFGSLTGVSDTTTQILARNETNLIRSGQVGAPVLKLLATYSPELPCLLEGADRYAPILSKSFHNNQVQQLVEINPKVQQFRHYDQRDLPEYGEVGHGPWCLGLPYPPVPVPPISLKDGTDIENEGTALTFGGFSLPPPGSLLSTILGGLTGGQGLGLVNRSSTASRSATSSTGDNRVAPAWARTGAFASGMSSGYAGTPGDTLITDALLAGRSGRAASDYGSLGPLLYGPLVRPVRHVGGMDR